MPKIDLNVDAGEGVANEAEIFSLVSSANIACGAHAGSLPIAWESARLADSLGLRLGLHPGFPDRAGFGRRAPGDGWTMSPDGIWNSLASHCELVMAGHSFAYIKPHGALYNLSTEPGRAAGWVEGLVDRYRLPLMGLPGTHHESIASHGFIREGFADRRYMFGGRLVPRTEPDAVLHDLQEIAAGVIALAERVDSICIHGDHPNAAETAALVRRTLEQAGWTISPER